MPRFDTVGELLNCLQLEIQEGTQDEGICLLFQWGAETKMQDSHQLLQFLTVSQGLSFRIWSELQSMDLSQNLCECKVIIFGFTDWLRLEDLEVISSKCPKKMSLVWLL